MSTDGSSRFLLTADAMWTMVDAPTTAEHLAGTGRLTSGPHATAAPSQLQPAQAGQPDHSSPDTVAVDNGTIRWVGSSHSVPESYCRWPSHVTAGTILPGFIDAHVHLTLAGDGRDYEAMAQDADEMMAIVALANLQRHLSAGVTTIRDNGGRNRVTFVVREAIERGYAVGPRMLLAGRPLTQSDGHFHWCNGVADDEPALRRAVQELAAEGADHIKIMASGGGTAGTRSDRASYSVSELRAAVETAHELGLLTTAHCHARTSMANVLDAGIDCMEHGYFRVPLPDGHRPNEFLDGDRPTGVFEAPVAYDGRLVERMAATGTYLSATLATGNFAELREFRHRLAHGPALTAEESARAAGLEQRFARKIELFAKVRADGLANHALISTDAGPKHVAFGHLFDGMSLGLQSGMRVHEVVHAVTTIPARACGIDHLVGTVEVGKRADLIVVPGDPATDASVLARPAEVYLDGMRLTTQGLGIEMQRDSAGQVPQSTGGVG